MAPADLEAAISASIFAAVNRERTPSSAARASLLAALRGSDDGEATARRLAALRAVTPADAAAALARYVAPLFRPGGGADVAVCVNAGRVADERAAFARDAGLVLDHVASLEEAFGVAAAAAQEPPAPQPCAAGAEGAAADGAKCGCVRCARPGGPFSL